MLMPIKVNLQSHDGAWPSLAFAEAARIRSAASSLVEIHHIGSTSIPGICAKPIVDLIGVAQNLPELDAQRNAIERIGYSWHGEFGLAGRRYCKLDDPVSGERLFQLHCYARNDPSIKRHLAFRDYLRANPEIAAAYAQEKERCAKLHPDDSHAYTKCKGDWIVRIEREALRLA